MHHISTLLPSPPPDHHRRLVSAVGDTAFSALDHVRLLHPAKSRGSVIFSQALPEWSDTAVQVGAQEGHAADLVGQLDRYVSCQTFYGGRRLKSRLAQLGCCHVDLDYYAGTKWEGCSPETVCTEVLAVLRAVNCPEPGLVLSSGRGLLVMWPHRLLPPAALPRWDAVQRQLFRLLAPFGADGAALDASRVFRLVGSRNSKSRELVRPIHVASSVAAGQRIGFDELAGAVLPLVRTEIVERRQRAKPARAARPATRLTRQSYYGAMLQDIDRLVQHRWNGFLPDGRRDEVLFCAAVAMAWIYPFAILERRICDMADASAGWPARKTRNKMGCVLDRARRAEAGQKDSEGRDPRYGMEAATVVSRLGISRLEMRAADFRVLLDPITRRERGAERKRRSRRAAGVRTRSEYEAAVAATAVADAEAVLAAYVRLGSIKAIAEWFSIAPGAAKMRLQRARRTLSGKQGATRKMVA